MRSVLLYRLAVVFLAACPAFSTSLAGEEGAPPAGEKPAPEKKASDPKAGEKKAGKKAAAKAESAAGEGKGATGIPITVKQISTWKKRMRQTYQAGNLTNLAIIIGNVLANEKPLSETKMGRECYGIACFYKSGFVAQEGKLDEAFAWIEKAIDNDYLSASDFEGMKELEPLKGDQRFIDRMKKLREEIDTLMRNEFEREVKEGVSKPSERLSLPSQPGSLPAGELSGIRQLAPAEIAARPACLIITPIHHDGFSKEAPILERMAEAYKDKAEVLVLFYQVDPQDAARKELTRKYVNETLHLKSKPGFKAAIVGREYVKPLGIPYFPAHYFLNSDGAVVYRKDGFLEESKLDFIFGELAKLPPKAAAPAATPKVEAPPAPKTEAPPAPKVPAPKEEPPPPKPEEKKPEEKKL